MNKEFLNYLKSSLVDHDIIVVNGVEFVDYENDVLVDNINNCNYYISNSVKLKNNIILLYDILDVIKDIKKIDDFVIKYNKSINKNIREFENVIFNKKDDEKLIIFTNIINRTFLPVMLFNLDREVREVKNEELLLNSILNTDSKYISLLKKLSKSKFKEIKFISNTHLFNDSDDYINYILNKYAIASRLISFKLLDFLNYNYLTKKAENYINLNISRLLFK